MPQRPRKKHGKPQGQRQQSKETAMRQCRPREHGQAAKETLGQRRFHPDEHEEAKLWNLYF